MAEAYLDARLSGWEIDEGSFGTIEFDVAGGRNAELDGFLAQVGKDAARCGRKPMLCWKRDRKPWLAFVPTNELEGRSFKFLLRYGEWSVIALVELLKLPDEFFAEDMAKVNVFDK